MYRFKYLIFIFLLLGVSPASAQESNFEVPELVSANIDSLIADSIRKAFILNHRPMDSAELNRIEIGQAKGFYGSYVSNYMRKVEFFEASNRASRQFIFKRNPPRLEWMFYSFALLFLFLSMISAFFGNYLQKVFRVFANQGFVYRQAKDQMRQAPLAAFLMNLLFVLSGTMFVFFGLGIGGPQHQTPITPLVALRLAAAFSPCMARLLRVQGVAAVDSASSASKLRRRVRGI
jgi:hypothetical protein